MKAYRIVLGFMSEIRATKPPASISLAKTHLEAMRGRILEVLRAKKHEASEEELEKEMEGVVFAKLNVDDNQEIAREFGIMSIPTLMIFKRGEMADMVVGVMAKDALRERIERHMD